MSINHTNIAGSITGPRQVTYAMNLTISTVQRCFPEQYAVRDVWCNTHINHGFN